MARKRHAGDDVEASAHAAQRAKPTGSYLGELFAAHDDLAIVPRDYCAEPPSQAIASSERGAEQARAKQSPQIDGILAVLARLPEGACISRDEIIARFGPSLTVNAACGRIKTMIDVLHAIEPVEDGATSNAGNRVTGYRLTAAGRARIRRTA